MSDVGANIVAEWGVVPEYVVPLSVFSNQIRLPSEKTDNGTTYSGTTPHSAKILAPTSDTDSLPCPLQKEEGKKGGISENC